MDGNTLRFLLFAAFSVASLLAGYFGRRSGWVDERHSRFVHYHTVVWTWSAASLCSLWRIPIRAESTWVVLIEVFVVVVPALLIIPAAKWIGSTRSQVGVLAVGAGVGNIGFTLGAYLCYALIEPRATALAYAGAATATLSVAIILFLYPVANHFGSTDSQRRGLRRLIAGSFLTLPALPLYTSLVGVGLSATGVPFPDALERYYLLDAILYAVSFGGYFGTGLRLRFRGGRVYWRAHLLLAGFMFGLTPLLTAGLATLTTLTPRPIPDLASTVMLVEAFMPTGVSCVILANVFHLDARMASSAWLWNTVLFLAVVLPVMLVLLS